MLTIDYYVVTFFFYRQP